MRGQPRPGEVGYLLGTAFLTCVECGVTSVLGLPYPVLPLIYTCTGCQERWQIDQPLVSSNGALLMDPHQFRWRRIPIS